jgi:7-cyano-7-deazaguanine synthase
VKAVCLVSGGPDSIIAAAEVKHEGFEVTALCIDYGQLSSGEKEAAEHLSKLLGFDLVYLNLSDLRKVMGVTSLVNPELEITPTFTDSIIVPNRNAILLSVGVALAYSVNAEVVAYGAHASDRRDYPDCREEFIELFQTAIQSATERKILVEAPNIKKSKAEVLLRGLELGVPLELTFSCYRNTTVHCGRCESCRNRKAAFKEAGISDKTVYEE